MKPINMQGGKNYKSEKIIHHLTNSRYLKLSLLSGTEFTKN